MVKVHGRNKESSDRQNVNSVHTGRMSLDGSKSQIESKRVFDTYY